MKQIAFPSLTLPCGLPVEGLYEQGSTAQTIALARQLQRNAEAREIVRQWLDILEEPIRYSNQDFDRRQGFSAELADLVRKELK